MRTTRRKTKVVGIQNYINAETGELVPMRVVEIEERDANFKKLWIGHLLDAIDELGSKKLQLLMWLFDQADAYNNIIGTVREISQKTNLSFGTVQTTLAALEEKNVLRRRTGVITLNPNVIFKGGTSARMDILIRYRNMSTKDVEKPNHNEESRRTEHTEALSTTSAQEVLPLEE